VSLREVCLTERRQIHERDIVQDTNTGNSIHERGKGGNPLPIILSQGWPDSFFRIYKIIPLLSDLASHAGDPADSFDVVVPSLPGFGFSDRPTENGFTNQRIAELFAKLMRDELGYTRFGAHGGDRGIWHAGCN
jgi:pimeloyl-ACP methyl ester carboxylesterase